MEVPFCTDICQAPIDTDSHRQTPVSLLVQIFPLKVFLRYNGGMSISATASVSLSGIRANFDALQISADNVARHEVPNSEKNRAVYITIAKGGVALTPQVIPMEDTQKTTTTDTYTASNIDYAEEQTNQKITTVSAKANIRVFNISNEMEKALLNIKV